MIRASSGNLYGTLTIPIDNELGIVALVIPDFGLTDRDGNSLQIGEVNSLKMLAHDLAGNGISALRIEKREVTESKKTPIVGSGVRIEDMVEDAVSWLRFLKADKRFSKVSVIGHGEGALVGILASEIADIKYYVSIAGAGRPGYEIVEANLIAQLPPEQMDLARTYIDEIRKGNMIDDIDISLASIFNPTIQTYLISWFKYNPAVEIANLDAKILLVKGEKDKLADSADYVRLISVCPKGEKLIVEGMDHMLKKGNEEEVADKVLDAPLAEGLVEGIASFLKKDL